MTTELAIGSNRPMPLWGSDTCRVVLLGTVDIFAVPLVDGRPAGARRHLVRLLPGEAFFGCAAPPALAFGLIAVGARGSRVREIPRSDAEAGAEAVAALEAWLDGWVTALTSAAAHELAPKDATALEVGTTVALAADTTARALRGVVWVMPHGGALRWLDRRDLPAVAEGRHWPVTPVGWVSAVADSRLECAATSTLATEGRAWDSLGRLHGLVLACIEADVAGEADAGRRRLDEQAASGQRALEGAFSQLAAVMEPEGSAPARRDDAPLLRACTLVGDALGITVVSHPDVADGSSRNPLGDIARASRLRVRQVALKGTWWQEDNGPLVAYTEHGRRPLALLPSSPRRYLLVDPADDSPVRITAEVASGIHAFAHAFYRPFAQQVLSLPALLRFGVQAARRDLLVVVATGIAIGLLGAVIPLASRVIVDTVIPAAERGQLVQIGLALLGAAVAALLFQITQSIALLRFEGKLDASLQAAVWDRVLSLPVTFFRGYTVGDLGSRAMSISSIRLALSGTTLASILAGLFSIFSFALLFYFDAGLAVLASVLVLLAVVVTVGAGYLQVRHQRQLVAVEGRISGIVLQLITGIAKLRVAGAEQRAFVHWATAFSEQKRAAYRGRAVENGVAVFNAAYPAVAMMALFAAIILSPGSRLSTGAFVGFNVAFSQFLAGALQVSFAVVSTMTIVPLYERIQPILRTEPEAAVGRVSPGELTGEIEVNQVSFRYQANGPAILKDVSLHIRSGEFVALVGASGSGKSTLLRLLLGFETPDTGAVYFDGQDLATLDPQEVRRQVGVVLQHGRLLTGTIAENIIGASLLSIEEALEAARMAGLDEDLRDMPMGVHTLVSEGGGTLSGGQRQRLLIARALASRPRVVFFDEATSALDNRTQAIVSESLRRLQATRIVIAHRLSTIINADRIYVMEGGVLVQVGTYAELMAQPGPFADLARRQLV